MANEEIQPAAPEAATDTPRKSPLLLAAVLAVTLLVGGAAGMKGVGPLLGPRLAEASLARPENGQGDQAGEPGEVSVHVVDNLVLNPAGSGGARFLLTSIALDAGSPEGAAKLAARDLEIRDAFIMVLGTKTVDQLTDVGNRARLIEELRASVDEILGPGLVRRVFIPQFVIQ
ncbi:MAG: flagellar basal body-associated FliL family protein [Deltaproteobacteria bacterium]|nr:flagellar basal body-associated FliL family protein [Deltaproteobacteria bacterium]